MGEDATVLYDTRIPDSMKKIVKKQGNEAGGAWECYHVNSFYGWESERVVAVTVGGGIMELITRARTRLSVILVEDWMYYAEIKKYFQQAAEQGLVEMVQLSEISQAAVDEANVEKTEQEIEDETAKDIEHTMEEKISWCCTS